MDRILNYVKIIFLGYTGDRPSSFYGQNSSGRILKVRRTEKNMSICFLAGGFQCFGQNTLRIHFHTAQLQTESFGHRFDARVNQFLDEDVVTGF